MSPTDPEFWDQRASKCGHTGWSSSVTYAYDQLARLKAIEAILPELSGRELAIDFGMGSGDFTALLSGAFQSVVACDIAPRVIEIARQRYGHLGNVRFVHAPEPEAIDVPDASCDLSLSITVLGAILEDDELVAVLRRLRRATKPSGALVALEVTSPEDQAAGTYLKFRSFSRWRALFEDAGFFLAKDYGFHHPLEAPSDSFMTHVRHPMVRLLARASRFTNNIAWVRRYYDRRAHSVLSDRSDFFWPGRPGDRMKIMVFKPAS
jgi:ubiquinone/menaquinone biosynthesis C-methylase UbiE